MQDFCFHPSNARDFLVVQGYQPAVCTQYAVQAGAVVAVRQYAKAPRNLLRCSPSGRFLLLGGFSNLAGEMELFDTLQFKRIGQAQDRDGAKSVQWTPDSRHVVLAVTRPWRRVDNGFKVFTYAGELLVHRTYDELYQVAVQPIADAAVLFPNRPASPGLKERRRVREAAESAEAARASSKSAASSASSYVPPHLRGRHGSDAVNSVSALIKGDRGGEGHKKLQHSKPKQHNGHSAAGKGGPESEASAAGGEGAGKRGGKRGSRSSDVVAGLSDSTTTAALSAEPTPPPPSSAAVVSSLSLDACEKRVKAVAKKAKQVVELRARAAQGEELDDGQRAKLASGPELDTELEQLRQRMAELRADNS